MKVVIRDGGNLMNKNHQNGFNSDIQTQLILLEEIIKSNNMLCEIIDRAAILELENYYIGAGCITQTVWNYLSGNDPCYGIKDIDFVYFDDVNLDFASENKIISRIKQLYKSYVIQIDVKNQARVHLWYKDHFGYDIAPYISLEAAINTWPTTASAIGVRRQKDNSLKVYAPFGLNDLYGKIVRANKAQITEEIYKKKTESWLQKWPDLKIVEWND